MILCFFTTGSQDAPKNQGISIHHNIREELPTTTANTSYEQWIDDFESNNPEMAARAWEKLIDSGSIVLPLLKKKIEHPDIHHRIRLAELLAHIRPQGLKILDTMTSDSNDWVKRAAMSAIGSYGSAVVPHLKKYLQSSEWLDQGVVLDAISLSGNEAGEARVEIENLQTSRKPFVKAAAISALILIEHGYPEESFECRNDRIIFLTPITCKYRFGIDEVTVPKRNEIARRFLSVFSPGELFEAAVPARDGGLTEAKAGFFSIKHIVPVQLDTSHLAYLIVAYDEHACFAEGFQIVGLFMPELSPKDSMAESTDIPENERQQRLLAVRETISNQFAYWKCIDRSNHIEILGVIDIENDGHQEVLISCKAKKYGCIHGADTLYRFDHGAPEIILKRNYDYNSMCWLQELSFDHRMVFDDVDSDGCQDLIVSQFILRQQPRTILDEIIEECDLEGRYVTHEIFLYDITERNFKYFRHF